MDVVLERTDTGYFHNDVTDDSKVLLNTAEILLATDYPELIAEVRELQRRRVSSVSIRRQRALRIGPARLRKVLQDHGLAVCTIGFAGGFTGTVGRSYRQAVDDTRRAIEYAAELQARAVIVVPGSKGLHTYGHAESTIRHGLEDCLDDALRMRVDMLLPLNSVLGNGRDVFQPRDQSRLDWIEAFGCHRIKSLMMLRGMSPWDRLPDCWRRCLTSGGALRISGRTRQTLGRHEIVSELLSRLDNAVVPVS